MSADLRADATSVEPLALVGRLRTALLRDGWIVALLVGGALIGSGLRNLAAGEDALATIDVILDAPGVPDELQPTRQPELESQATLLATLVDRGTYLSEPDEIGRALEAEGLDGGHQMGARSDEGVVRIQVLAENREAAERAVILHTEAFVDGWTEQRLLARDQLAAVIDDKIAAVEARTVERDHPEVVLRSFVERDGDLTLTAELLDAFDVLGPVSIAAVEELTVATNPLISVGDIAAAVLLATLFSLGLIALRELTRERLRSTSDLTSTAPVLADLSHAGGGHRELAAIAATSLRRRRGHDPSDRILIVPADEATAGPGSVARFARELAHQTGWTIRTAPPLSQSALATAAAANVQLVVVVAAAGTTSLRSVDRVAGNLRRAGGRDVQLIVLPSARIVDRTPRAPSAHRDETGVLTP